MERIAADAGFGTAASLRQHLHAAIGVVAPAPTGGCIAGRHRTGRSASLHPARAGWDTGAVTAATTADLKIPADLKPADGRFGCGPSKVRPEQLAALAGAGRRCHGHVSHRQKPVKSLVGRVRAGLAELFSLPEGYEVVLGNGGVHGVLGRRGVRAGARARAAPDLRRVLGEVRRLHRSGAPFLADPVIVKADAGQRPGPAARPELRRARLGAQRDLHRRRRSRRAARTAPPTDQLVVIDATSGAGGLPVDIAQADAYYFAPQKGFASDGGLWIALMSPAALERVAELAAYATGGSRRSCRWPRPSTTRARTRPTTRPPSPRCSCWPTRSTGCSGSAASTAASPAPPTRRGGSTPGPRSRSFATPFVADPAHRSQVVGTIDFADAVDAAAVAKVLRANGIVDTEPYRKLGRNQLRIGMFPAVEPDDVSGADRLHRLGGRAALA